MYKKKLHPLSYIEQLCGGGRSVFKARNYVHYSVTTMIGYELDRVLLESRPNDIVLCLTSIKHCDVESLEKYQRTCPYVDHLNIKTDHLQVGHVYLLPDQPAPLPKVAMLMGNYKELLLLQVFPFLVARSPDYPIDDSRRKAPVTINDVDDTLCRRNLWLFECLNELNDLLGVKDTFSMPEDMGQGKLGFNQSDMFGDLGKWMRLMQRSLRIYPHYVSLPLMRTCDTVKKAYDVAVTPGKRVKPLSDAELYASWRNELLDGWLKMAKVAYHTVGEKAAQLTDSELYEEWRDLLKEGTTDVIRSCQEAVFGYQITPDQQKKLEAECRGRCEAELEEWSEFPDRWLELMAADDSPADRPTETDHADRPSLHCPCSECPLPAEGEKAEAVNDGPPHPIYKRQKGVCDIV